MRKPTNSLSVPAMLVSAVACDPGMTISQTSTPGASASREPSVRVKTSHVLSARNWYSPDVSITNSSEAPITVTRLELTTRSAKYENAPRRAGTYPLPVPPAGTADLDVWFDLQSDLATTFSAPAQLRVFYQIAGQERVALASVKGQPQ